MAKKSEKPPVDGVKNAGAEKPPAKKVKKTSTTSPKDGKQKKRGTPSEYPNKVKPYLADIERYVRCGVTEGQICDYYGVGRTQWAQYKKDNPELTETLLRAKQAFQVELVNQAYKTAMGYYYEEEYTTVMKDKDGNITGEKVNTRKRYSPPDVGMIQFLLINRFKAEFARDPHAVELRKKALELAAEGKLSSDDVEGI